jgi:hypothetical protein
MCKMCEKGNGMAKTAMILSLITLIISAFDFLTKNDVFGIAGTQWILISIALGVYSNFFAQLKGEKKE